MRYIPIYAALLAALATPALAQTPRAEQGNGLVCDTAEQIEQVMLAYDKSRDWQASLVAVNAEKVVCAVLNILYFKGDKIKELDTQDGHFNIVEITVVAAVRANGIQPITPEKQVTIFRPKQQEGRKGQSI
jgi:hypothetical protein